MEFLYQNISLTYSFFFKLNLLDYFLGTIITRTWGHTYLFSFIWPNYAATAALYLCILTYIYLSLQIEVCNFLYFPTSTMVVISSCYVFLFYLYFSGLDTRDLFSTIRNKFQFQFLNKYSSNWMRAAKIRNSYVYYTYISLNFYFMLWNGNFKKTFFFSSFKSCHRVFIGLLGKKNERKMRNFL